MIYIVSAVNVPVIVRQNDAPTPAQQLAGRRPVNASRKGDEARPEDRRTGEEGDNDQHAVDVEA